jgi:hypothetical protein
MITLRNLRFRSPKARVKNLVEQRRKLKEHFIKDGLFNLDDKNITQVDKVFSKKWFSYLTIIFLILPLE